MIKKIVVGTLLAVMIASLVYGAWYRTQARTADESATDTSERHGQSAALAQGEADLQQGSGYRGAGGSAGGQDPALGNPGTTSRGGNRSSDLGIPLKGGSPQAEVTELVTFTGTVENISDAGVIVAIAGELPVEIAGRALSYATEQGFVFHQGDTLALTGFYEEQDFEVQALENFTTGQSLALREQNGRPMWAGGRGRGSG